MGTHLATRYELRELLGAGGMGSVWRAWDRVGQIEVAVKRSFANEAQQNAFRQEYWWMTRLSHPNLLNVYDFGTDEDGVPFYAMELVQGQNLTELLPLPLDELVRMLKQVGSALRSIHLQGLVHCDVKPDNIRRDENGDYKLFDFGLMLTAGHPAQAQGTLAYMAPEVIQQARIDQRADLYSVGILIFQALTGRLPFEQGSSHALMRAHLSEIPSPPSQFNRAAKGFWDRLVVKLLAKDPARRLQSAADLLEGLGEHCEPDPPVLLCPPFIGREAEIEKYSASVQELIESGKGNIHGIAGPVGSGKSRLLSEMAVRTQLAGVRVVKTTVGEGPAPYQPLVDIIRQAWDELCQRDPELLKQHAPSLRTLVPDLLPDEKIVPLEPRQAKIRLQTALVDLLLALEGPNGLVLMIDDWHLAHPLAQEVVEALQRNFLGTRLLLVLAGSFAVERPWAAKMVSHILPPLRTREANRIISAMFSVGQVPKPFTQQVMELTGGSPQAIESLLSYWVSTGVITHREGKWHLAEIPKERLRVTEDSIVLTRLAALDRVERTVLEVLAVWQTPVPLTQLRLASSDIADEHFFIALQSLEQQRLVDLHENGYVLEQKHLGYALLEQLSSDEQRALNRRAATAIEACRPEIWSLALSTGPHQGTGTPTWESSQGEAFVQLAAHYYAAAMPSRAVPYSCAASQYLASLHDTEAARKTSEQGLKMAEQISEGLGLEIGSVAPWKSIFEMLLGDSKRVAGELNEAYQHYDRALLALEGDEYEWATIRSGIGQGLILQSQGRPLEARERLREILPKARTLLEGREELRCLAALGRLNYQLGDISRARAVYEEALARAQVLRDESFLGDFLGNLGFLDVVDPPSDNPLAVEEGVQMLKESIELQTRIGDKLGLNDSYMLFGNALYLLGDFAQAEYAFLKNQGLCQDLGFHEEDIAWTNLAMVSLERGYYQQAFDYAQKAASRSLEGGGRFVRDMAASFEARAWLGLGHWQRATDLLATSLESQREAEDGYGELYSLMGRMECHIFLGRLDAAEDDLLSALGVQARLGINDFALPLQLVGVRLAVYRKQWSTAELQCRDVLARSETRRAQYWEAEACLLMGNIAKAADKWDEVDTWFARAADLATRCGARILQLKISFEQGLKAERDDDILTADAYLVKAQEIATELAAPEWQSRCAFARARLHFPSPRAAGWLRDAYDWQKPLLAGLTFEQKNDYLQNPDRRAISERALNPSSEIPFSSIELTTETTHGVSASAPQRAGHVIQRGRWFDELQRTVERLQKQLEFAQSVQNTSDEEMILRSGLQLFSEVCRLPRVDLLIKDGTHLSCRTSLNTHENAPEEDWSFYAKTVISVAHSGELAYVPSLTLDHEDPRAVLAVPLGDDKERWGVLFALGYTSDHQNLAPWDIEALRLLADQLLAALRRARLEAEWRAKTQRLEMLYTLSSTITSTLVMEEVLDLVLKFSLEVTQAERGIIFLVSENGDLRGQAARIGETSAHAKTASESVSRSILRRVLDTGEALCVEDAHDDDVFRHQKSIQDLNLRTVMAVPLSIQKRPLGVLYVDSRVVVNTFSERDLEILRAIASHASVALENARLYDLATVDRLTKLYFRSHFEQRLREELARAMESGRDLSLLMMDIDHFKKFNDTYGHAVGDQVLAHVAKIIRSNVRQDIDIPCRYGGEEMLVLLPETDEQGANIFAERLRHAIDVTPLPSEEHGPLHVTISIGTASCPKDASNSLHLMELADQALYHSKRHGRNRVTSFSPGVSV